MSNIPGGNSYKQVPGRCITTYHIIIYGIICVMAGIMPLAIPAEDLP